MSTVSMGRWLTRLLSLSLGSTLMLLLINGVASYRNTRILVENERQVAHTQQVITKLEQTFSTLKDAETGQRGYLLTGKSVYLQPYQTAIAQVNRQLDDVRQLTADNPVQQQRTRSLEQSIAAKLAELQKTIDLYRRQGRGAALQVVQTDRGKQLMDQIRQQVGVMEAEETRLLQQRSQQSLATIHSVLLMFFGLNGLGVLLVGLVYYLLQRADREQWQAAIKRGQLFQALEAERDQLRESEQRLRLTIQEAPIPLILHAGGEILQLNRMWTELSGYSLADMPTVDGWIELAYRNRSPAERANIRTGTQQLNQLSQRVEEGEFAIFTASSQQRCWDFYSAPIGQLPDGRTLVITAALDVTTHKQAEAEIRQLNATLEQRVAERTDQLQEANQALEAFSYSVSHDLRAPLRTLQGFAQALQEDYQPQLDELAQSYIHYIMEGAEQMDTLISDLLNYSRLSRAQISLSAVDLNSAIAEALKQLNAPIQERQAQIEITSPLPSVLAHRPTLIQVLTNLIGNAIKFVKPNVIPVVQIWVDHLWVEAAQPRSLVRLWVQDNGIGIAPEHQERIFRVFERLHGVETYPGTGIGLAIVRKGLERMGGQIGLESQLGQGSRFWIALPRAVLANETGDGSN